MIHYHPVITLDEAHSKATYKGVYLGLSCVDGEGHLVPIAFGSAPIENTENWTWFCAKVVEAIPFLNSSIQIMVSNRKKGIESGAATMLSMAAHVACVWYIENNINTYYKSKLNGNIWAAAWAFTKDAYLLAMVQIMEIILRPTLTSVESQQKCGR